MDVFAISLIVLPIIVAGYAYVVYPAILSLLPRKDRESQSREGSYCPLVTFVIPAYNEGSQIRSAIEGLLQQDYPRDRVQILILSDASTDDTDEIVREFEGRGVELLRM